MNNTTTLTTFFDSLYFNEICDGLTYFDALLSNSFDADYINQKMKYDAEEAYLDFGLFFQCFKKIIRLVDKFTGEILFEIPLTAENLEKSILDIIPENLKGNKDIEIYANFG